MKTNILVAAFAIASSSAFAGHFAVEAAKEIIVLKDGGSLYIFPDGKMGKESRVGSSVYLKKGEVLEAADGRMITATSNEVARMTYLLSKDHSNN